MKKKFIFALGILLSITFTGCDDEKEVDGEWDPIQITVNEKICLRVIHFIYYYYLCTRNV